MEKSNKDEISDISFQKLKIGDDTVEVNMVPSVLKTFSDMTCKEHQEKVFLENNVEIPKSVIGKMFNPEKLNGLERVNDYVKRRNEVVEKLTRGTYNRGFEKPSTVQELSIVPMMIGQNCLVQFNSGTGKTFAFLLGALSHFDLSDPSLQFIFITSTHEVAEQIYKQARELLPEALMELCVGFRKESQQIMGGGFKSTTSTSTMSQRPRSIAEEIKAVGSAQIMIGTMGKIFSYLVDPKVTRNNVKVPVADIRYIKAIILDEFDQLMETRNSKNMTTLSSAEQLRRIITMSPPDTQLAFFSATISPDSLREGYRYFEERREICGEPFIMLLETGKTTLLGIKQYYIELESYKDKYDTLIDLLKGLRVTQAIVFVNRVETAFKLQTSLKTSELQLKTGLFHGQLSSNDRDRVINDFRDNNFKVLISSDISARGLDIQSVNLVINFDMPDVLQTYVHRIGRSGRYGRIGCAISFIINDNKTLDQRSMVAEINAISEGNNMISLTEVDSDLSKLI